MEVIGAVSAITSLLKVTAHVIRLSTEYIRAARGAEKSAERLRKELRDLRGILEELEAYEEQLKHDDVDVVEMRFLNAIQQPTSEAKAMLQSIGNKLEVSAQRHRIKSSLLWPFQEKEVEKQTEALSRFRETFHLALSLDTAALTKDIWSDVRRLSITHNEKSHQEVVAFFDVADTHTNHSLARGKHQEGTGAWLLENKSFRAWVKTPKTLVWLHGIPGCGKTILSSTVIDYLQKNLTKAHDSTLAYFYFDYNDTRKQNVSTFLSCILSQLTKACNEIPSSLLVLFKNHKDQEEQPSAKTLLNTFIQVARSWSSVFLVIDALDECEQHIREDLLKILETLATSDAHIRIFTTSRAEQDIKEFMVDAADYTIAIQNDRVDADIGLYVRAALNADPKMRKWSLSDRQLVLKTLTGRANGMFRWAYCQLDTLRKCMNRAAVHRTLKALPKTLDQTYERIITNIAEEYRCQAIIALHWLSFTRRPLKVFELAEAVAVESYNEGNFSFTAEERLFRPDLILDICSSLVSASGPEQSADVRLAHFSVQEYLLSERIRGGPVAEFSVSLQKGNAIMAEFCVSYMMELGSHARSPICGTGTESIATPRFTSQPTFAQEDGHDGLLAEFFIPDEDENKNFDDSVLRYAVENWFWHANCITEHLPQLSGMILQLLAGKGNKFNIKDWWDYASQYRVSVWYHLSDVTELGGPLGTAAYLGLLPEVKLLIDLDQSSGPARQSNLNTALCAAAYGGHRNVVDLSLENGAIPSGFGNYFASPLQAAASRGSYAIVKLLLENDADLNFIGGRHGTALHAAAHAGSLDIVQMLLRAGANPGIGGGYGEYGNALQAAAYQVNEEMVKELLHYGANPNEEGGKYGTALQAAAYRSALEITKLLLQNGSDPNLKTGQYGTPLQAATHWGNKDIVQLLLASGSDPNACGGDYLYGTALQAAASWNYTDILIILLDHGADPNLEAGSYGSALEAAIYREDRAMCRLLLERGAKLEAHGNSFNPNTTEVGGRDHEADVDLLMNSVRTHATQMGCYGKAVFLANQKGQKEWRAHFLDGLSAASFATLRMEDNIRSILSDENFDEDRLFSGRFQALHWACWNNDAAIIQMILSQRLQASVHSRELKFSEKDWSPLHLAIYLNHHEAASAICNFDGYASLSIASEVRHATSKLLIDDADWCFVSLNATYPDVLGWTVVHVAALLGAKKALYRWKDHHDAFSIDVLDSNSMTPLHWSSASGSQDMVKTLLVFGADVDVRDRWGRKPIDLAAGSERMAIIRMLAGDGADAFPVETILSHGRNCPCWRTCDSCDVLFKHADIFLHCEACNDLDLCERCVIRERGCKNRLHSPELWELNCRMAALSTSFQSVEDLLQARMASSRYLIPGFVI